MELRPLDRKDLAQVVEIQQRITRNPVTDRWKEMLARHVGCPDLPGLVAELRGEVVGFIIGEVKVGGFGTELSGWLEMVGVKPEHMGSGIGQSLAQGLFKHFHARGVLDIFTSVRWDSGDMLAFFKDLGFDRSHFINLQLRMEQQKK